MKALVHLPEILRKQVILLVAGGGRADYFRKIAQKLNVNDNIRFLGYVASMRELYVSSDILLHPVLYEPFANVCIEALACGLPVITTRNNGASELINEGENGFLVDSADQVELIAEKIVKFADLSGMRNKIIVNALKTVEKLSWEQHIEKLLEIFKKLK